jgi:hypothetical protein
MLPAPSAVSGLAVKVSRSRVAPKGEMRVPAPFDLFS